MHVLPEKKRKLVIIRDASHGFPWSHAGQYRQEVLKFLKDM